MKRIDCLRILNSKLTNELVATTLTGTAWEWNHVSQREGNIKVGSMGNASAVALGMALGLPTRRVFGLDSDGSVFMDLATLTTIGTYMPPNLSILVFDNERYSGTRIDQPSPSALGSDLEAIALGAGISTAKTVRTLEEFETAIEMDDEDGSTYIVVKIENEPTARNLPKPTHDYQEQKYHFWRYIERTENVEILGAVW